MKIIQSFWSSRSLALSESKIDRNLGGWSHSKYHWLSWAMSCLTIKKYYSEIELITDSRGKEILIDYLQLPYTNVKTSLDLLKEYESDLFTIGKIFAYSIQDKPFIHIDSDVYIWKRFSKEIEEGQLVAQNDETNLVVDQKIFDEINMYFSYIPDVFKNYSGLRSSNAGIIGGKNVRFFKEFADVAFRFINNNTKNFYKLSQPNLLHLVYEQYLFASLARKKNISIEHLFLGFNNSYSSLIAFEKVPIETQFIHLLGPFKRQKLLEVALENRMLLEFPEQYYKIINLISKYEI